jgi:DNA-directed RNA polymerase specialized sigma24 family protein
LAIELPYAHLEDQIMSSTFYECPTMVPDAVLHHATGEEVREAFREHREELAWLAVFLTADEELAKVCLVDAFALAIMPKDVFARSLERWTRRCTIGSALEMQHSRIALLARVYECAPYARQDHAAVSPIVLDLLYETPEEVALRLDALCRAALVLRGIERYSPIDSAHILGVSRTAVEAAYCVALQELEILGCETLSRHTTQEASALLLSN